MALYNTEILATNTTLASGSGERAITTVIVCNTTGGDLPLTLYAVANGGSAGAGTMIVNALNVPAGDTVISFFFLFSCSSGDALVAVSSGTGLTATVSTLAV